MMPGFPVLRLWSGSSCEAHRFVLTSATHRHKICTSNVHTKGLAMRNTAINLRALPEQRDLIDQAASLLGKTRSDFMLESSCERAQTVLLDQVHFRLDAEKFNQFVALLDAPLERNSGLERLLSVQAPWKESSEV